MPVCRSVLHWALPLLLVALGSPVHARRDARQDWVGDLNPWTVFLTSDDLDRVYVLIDGDDNIIEAIPNVCRAADFPLPFWYRDKTGIPYWHGGALYTLAYGDWDRDEEGKPVSRLWSLVKWEEGRWHHLGGIRTGPLGMPDAIPCDGGRFIFISSDMGMFGGEGPDPTPFRVVSLPQAGTGLRLGRAIDHGQDGLRRCMSRDECFGLAWHSAIAKTDSHAVLVNKETGLYWVFSLGKASLVKAGNIFKKVTPRMAATGGFPDAVLCIGAERSGTVLVAAQEESFFMTEKGDALREMNESWDSNPGLSRDAAEAEYIRRSRELAERNPFIAWYRIHPESGRVERLHEPPEGGTLFRDGGKNDGFRPMLDGSVKLGWDPGKLREKVAKGPDGAGKKAGAAEASLAGCAPRPENPESDAGGLAESPQPPEGCGADGGTDEGKGRDEGKGAGKSGAPAG